MQEQKRPRAAEYSWDAGAGWRQEGAFKISTIAAAECMRRLRAFDPRTRLESEKPYGLRRWRLGKFDEGTWRALSRRIFIPVFLRGRTPFECTMTLQMPYAWARMRVKQGIIALVVVLRCGCCERCLMRVAEFRARNHPPRESATTGQHQKIAAPSDDRCCSCGNHDLAGKPRRLRRDRAE